MKKFNENQSGRSMIEMLGVLAIVGVLSVAGIAGYSKAMTKYKINKVLDEVSTIAANVKTMFASVGVYSDLTNLSTAYSLGLLPEEMTKSCEIDSTSGALKATTCVVNGLGGGVTLTGSTDDFTLTMTGLTDEACVTMLTSDWGGAAGFKSVTSGAGSVTPSTSAADAFTQAVAGCTAGGSGNTIEWKFY